LLLVGRGVENTNGYLFQSGKTGALFKTNSGNIRQKIHFYLVKHPVSPIHF
jgi:hypothetical protein